MDPGSRPGLPGAAAGVLAVAAGGAIANDYALQPAVAAVARDLHSSIAPVSWALTGAMGGYLIGLVLLVPLIDRVPPNRLVPAQLTALAAALGVAATVTGPTALIALIACFVAVGAATTVAAQSTALVGRLATTAARGTHMGVVAAGISAGILLSRVVGGGLTTWLGWRAMLGCFAALCLATAAATRLVLPREAPPAGHLPALRSIPLLATHPSLRRACLAGMLWFGAFNLVWVGLSLRLAEPPYSLDASTIGLYSLAGLLGLAVTRPVGRLTDRWGPRRVGVAGLACAALAALGMATALDQPVRTLVAVAIFDAGCFAAQVANQVAVVSIRHERSGALSSAYLTLYYAAGAIGTAAAAPVLAHAGWVLVALLAALAVGLAAAVTLLGPGRS